MLLDLTLTPNRSLPRDHARMLILGIGGLFLIGSIRFLILGLWPVIPFMIADVALLAQSEVHAITLAHGGGSSAMAHKSNPVAAETLVALARFNAGLAGTLQQAMVHEYERSGAAWTLEWLTLPPMLETTGASLLTTQRLLEQIQIS